MIQDTYLLIVVIADGLVVSYKSKLYIRFRNKLQYISEISMQDFLVGIQHSYHLSIKSWIVEIKDG